MKLNLSFITTIFLLGFSACLPKLYLNKYFLLSLTILLFFLLQEIDYYAIYFSTFYLTIILAYFIGKYTPEINTSALIKTLFFVFIFLNCIYYFFYTKSPFIIEDRKLRMISIAGGPPATSFLMLFFFTIFVSYKKNILAAASFLMLMATGNRISILAAFTVLLLLFLVRINFRKAFIAFLSAALLTIVLKLTGILDLVLRKTRFIDETGALNLGTLRGRFVHWNWALENFKESTVIKKLFGHGINSTKEIFFTTNSFKGETTGSGAMHNEWLRILTENGLVGISLVMLFFIRHFRRWKNNPGAVQTLCILCIIFITSLTDNILYSYYNYLTLCFFILGYQSNKLRQTYA